MISMTGYAKVHQQTSAWVCEIELQAVNSKYLDIHMHIPTFCKPYEHAMRQRLKERVHRGKLACSVALRRVSTNALAYEVDGEALQAYRGYWEAFAGVSGETLTFTDFIQCLNLPDVLVKTEERVTYEVVADLIDQTLGEALEKFCETCAIEGAHIADDMRQKLMTAEELTSQLTQRVPEMDAAYFERLRQKMLALLEDTQVDEQRLIQEAAMMANKTAIDEELLRLRSHCTRLRQLMSQDDAAVGKECDFYFQEMHREVNTIASKVNDLEATDLVVRFKGLIEQMREQIQNIA